MFLVTSGSHSPHVIEEPLQQNFVHLGCELFLHNKATPITI